MDTTETGETAKRGRAKNGQGRLYEVGGKWFLRFMHKGVMQPRVQLKDDSGAPCTNKRAAEKARTEYLEDFRAEARMNKKAGRVKVSAMEKGDGAGVKRKEGRTYISEAWGLFVEKLKDDGNMPSQATLSDYRSIFSAFSDWAREKACPATYLADATEEVAEDYKTHLNRETKFSPRTFNRHIVALRHIWRTIRTAKSAPWLRDRANPWANIKGRKEKKNGGKRKPLSPEQAREILAESVAVTDIQAGGRRGTPRVVDPRELPTFFMLLYHTGARMGDVCRWKWSEAKLKENRIDFTMHKNGLEHAVWIHPALSRWLKAIPGKHDGYILPTLAALYERKTDYVCIVSSNIFKAAGIETNEEAGEDRMRKRVIYGLHSFRHGLGTIATENGATLTAAQAVLGHSTGDSSRMTAHYAHLGAEAGKPAVLAIPDISKGIPPPGSKPEVVAAWAKKRADEKAEKAKAGTI